MDSYGTVNLAKSNEKVLVSWAVEAWMRVSSEPVLVLSLLKDVSMFSSVWWEERMFWEV